MQHGEKHLEMRQLFLIEWCIDVFISKLKMKDTPADDLISSKDEHGLEWKKSWHYCSIISMSN